MEDKPKAQTKFFSRIQTLIYLYILIFDENAYECYSLSQSKHSYDPTIKLSLLVKATLHAGVFQANPFVDFFFAASFHFQDDNASADDAAAGGAGGATSSDVATVDETDDSNSNDVDADASNDVSLPRRYS